MGETMKIKELFDAKKDIYRTIEKVITYDVNQSERLSNEINEYVVTEHVDKQFEGLLDKMQTAMESGGENEVGVWVSGFYGSGKSSFTKYLGFAFDTSIDVNGHPFHSSLQSRLNRPQTKALLNTVVQRFPAAVLMIDLATDQLSGATMSEVSTVLFYKVLHWAGYSQNKKIAAFERKLKKENRYEEFLTKCQDMVGMEWNAVKNDPLISETVVPEIAHEMYPDIFKTIQSFNVSDSDFVQFENDRVREMIDIIKEESGKDYIIFVVDEVGQYVGARPNLILNLDGLAKNLKNIGDGKVWFIGTAQQTLTEDDAGAALNSPELYKLKDRFPIQIELESSDIKEITTKRLLGKSSSGEATLGKLFDQYGQSLRQHTNLENAKYYDSQFDKKLFTDLYPFLPTHFEILLRLLSALAKSTGGVGLRSAIKIIQDILVVGADDMTPIAEQKTGWLANSATLFDSMEKEIKKAFPNQYAGFSKVKISDYYDSPVHLDVAKTVLTLQILDNLPITTHNVASLLHDSISAQSRLSEVTNAIEDLIKHPKIPFGEQDGELKFFSEKLNDIELERSQIPLRSVDTRRIFSEILKELMSPLPSVTLFNSLSITSGIKFQASTGAPSSINGDGNAIQTIIEIRDSNEYEDTKNRLIDESRIKSNEHTIFLLGHNHADIDSKLADIYRSQAIATQYNHDADNEVKEYCKGQLDRARKLMNDLETKLKQLLSSGSFIFRGQATAVETLSTQLNEAHRKIMHKVGIEVYDRYEEASVRADTSVAEKFLKAESLNSITSQIDPLGLVVRVSGGQASIKTDQRGLLSIKEVLERNGNMLGKDLTERFKNTPYGWSPDTLRYMVAAILMAGEVKLRISGNEITVNGQQAIEALKTNNTFKNIGVSLREDRPDNDLLARAAKRLTTLFGEDVIPLEDDISKAAMKQFPQLQQHYAPLAEKLIQLNLPGSDRLQDAANELAQMLQNDASEAPSLLGREESSLYDTLVWARSLKNAFDKGLEQILKSYKKLSNQITDLPSLGVPGKLKEDSLETLKATDDYLQKNDFHSHASEYESALMSLNTVVTESVNNLQHEQTNDLENARAEIISMSSWSELNKQEQDAEIAKIESLQKKVTSDMAGLQHLLNHSFEFNQKLSSIKLAVKQTADERIKQKLEEERAKAKEAGKTKIEKPLSVRSKITTVADLEALISELQELKREIELYQEIDISVQVDD